jgi:PAS domain-containing protein
VLTPQLVYADANEEFLRLAGRTREQPIGHYLSDDFPDELDHHAVAVRRNIEASLRRVADTGKRDAIPLQRYDVEDPDRPGVREERYWSSINAPVFGSDGRVALLLHRVEEVTELIAPARSR